MTMMLEIQGRTSSVLALLPGQVLTGADVAAYACWGNSKSKTQVHVRLASEGVNSQPQGSWTGPTAAFCLACVLNQR